LYLDAASQTLTERRNEEGLPQTVPLQVQALPLSFSFGVEKDKLIVDPASDEEEKLLSCLTVCVNSEGVCTGTMSNAMLKLSKFHLYFRQIQGSQMLGQERWLWYIGHAPSTVKFMHAP
jgi:exosome complex RNA-binding protein Rrp42 (RNase PH superfamily)